MEFFRDQAANNSSAIRLHLAPAQGSMVNHRALTSAMIDSRDFLAANGGPRPRCCCRRPVAFTGGLDFNDVSAIWDRLDKVHASIRMVLLHGGSPKGAERIAANGPTPRKVPQIAFKPIGPSNAKAAAFKTQRPDAQVLPIGIIIFPGFRNPGNLADKAKKLGIPCGGLARAARECRVEFYVQCGFATFALRSGTTGRSNTARAGCPLPILCG